MKLLRSAVVYTALALGANPALADAGAYEALRNGDMKKLIFHQQPQEVSAAVFTTPDGTEVQLSSYAGKHILLNFWATWCAPCRKEMPSLDALQQEFGGDTFEVVTLATGRNSLEGIRRFFEEESITALPILLDPKQGVARDMAVLGLPISVLIDPDGQEIARLRGDADWYSEDARALIAAITEAGS